MESFLGRARAAGQLRCDLVRVDGAKIRGQARGYAGLRMDVLKFGLAWKSEARDF